MDTSGPLQFNDLVVRTFPNYIGTFIYHKLSVDLFPSVFQSEVHLPHDNESEPI